MLRALLKLFAKPLRHLFGTALIKGSLETFRFVHSLKKEKARRDAARKESTSMKKNAFIAAIAALAAVAGALAAVYVYLRRREKELDEYEHLLFSEEFDDKKEAEPAAPEKIEAPDTDAE
jgi:hypothetical protein